jgi:predicted outer membrane repeat protein
LPDLKGLLRRREARPLFVQLEAASQLACPDVNASIKKGSHFRDIHGCRRDLLGEMVTPFLPLLFLGRLSQARLQTEPNDAIVTLSAFPDSSPPRRMTMPRLPIAPRLSPKPIAAALIGIFALAPLEALAVKMVGNCNDSGPGSLRQALLDAAEGELVDATGLPLVCSKISLTSTLLIVANDAQTISGPGSDKLTIDAAALSGSPVFSHNRTGTLEIDHVAVVNGTKYRNEGTSDGGCITSQGNLKLDHVLVSNCTVTAKMPVQHARGGAIYAAGYVKLTQSVVSDSSTHAMYKTYGGGVYAKGGVTIDHSTISGNTADSGGGIFAKTDLQITSSTISGNTAVELGGGFMTHGSLQMTDSTVSNNTAHLSGGFDVAFQATVSKDSFIRNSTITGNTIDATFSAAAAEIGVPITISNSTIAFNIAANSIHEGALYALGGSMTLQSSIIAENYPFDVGVQTGTGVDGSNNLSPNSKPNVMPQDTKRDCPLLEPLAYTGGPTATLALKHNSPAINSGNNLVPLANDQRGSGFPREFGAVDIGAWEWQGGADDDIFHDGFSPLLGACHN